MKLTVSKQLLSEAIQNVSKAISGKSPLPILNGIKIDADSAGMTLTASDTEISIKAFIPPQEEEETTIQLIEPGSVVLPAKFFTEIIKKLPSNQVEIEVSSLFQTVIRSGSSEIQMIGLDPEEYPELPTVENKQTISLSSDLLKQLIHQTTFAVSTNETTPILTGVLWMIRDGQFKWVACDRHRLAQAETPMQLSGEALPQIVIAGKTLNELAKIIPDQNILVEIVLSDNQVLFKLDRLLFFSRILDGTYPDTSKLIPDRFQTEIIVNTKELADAIDRAYLLSREEKTNIVRLVMNEDQTIEISSGSSELGNLKETIRLESISGELLKIAFNSKYMLDALKVMDSDTIKIGFTGSMSPIIIKPNDGSSQLQLILPYRTVN